MPQTRKLLFWGCGPLGEMLVDTALELGYDELAWIADHKIAGETVAGWPVYGNRWSLRRAAEEGFGLVLAAGRSALRLQMWHFARQMGIPLLSLLDPRAQIARSAELGEACLILGGAVVQVGARLGPAVFVHNQAYVGHHASLAEGVSLYVGARVLGRARIGTGTELGASATVLTGTDVGAWAQVGLGAGVIRDLPERSLAVGTPARVLRTLPVLEHEALWPLAETES